MVRHCSQRRISSVKYDSKRMMGIKIESSMKITREIHLSHLERNGTNLSML